MWSISCQPISLFNTLVPLQPIAGKVLHTQISAAVFLQKLPPVCLGRRLQMVVDPGACVDILIAGGIHGHMVFFAEPPQRNIHGGKVKGKKTAAALDALTPQYFAIISNKDFIICNSEKFKFQLSKSTSFSPGKVSLKIAELKIFLQKVKYT